MKADKGELRRLYWDENMRPVEIAALYGVSRGTINQWLIDYKIPRKGMSYSAKLRVETTGECMGRPVRTISMYKDI